MECQQNTNSLDKGVGGTYINHREKHEDIGRDGDWGNMQMKYSEEQRQVILTTIALI